MVDIFVSIGSPVAGEEVGLVTAVAGTVTVSGLPWNRVLIDRLQVQFGLGAEVVAAQLGPVASGSRSFSCSGPLPANVQSGQLVTIAATVSGFIRTPRGPHVALARRRDDDQDPFPDPEPKPEPEPEPEPFEHSVSVVVRVLQPFVPGPVELVFEPTSYLTELMALAGTSVSVNAAPPGPSPQDLAARLFQPLHRLTEPALFEAATAPLQQARIAVEVLRGAAGTPAPAGFGELDQRYRAGCTRTSCSRPPHWPASPRHNLPSSGRNRRSGSSSPITGRIRRLPPRTLATRPPTGAA